MNILVDSNILLRIDHRNHPHNALALEAIRVVRAKGHTLRTIPQTLYEYWVVATRPVDVNGLGFSTEEANRFLDDHVALFPPFRDERGVLQLWKVLVVENDVKGKPAHDARIVAGMLKHGVSFILTFNEGDFQRYDEVTAVTPRGLLADDTLIPTVT